MEWLKEVARYLVDRDLKLASAESCTAGLVISELARVPGSGQAIDCGLVVYSPEAKNRYLAVSYETIERCGLTCEATSREMALGALDNNNADLAIANTGIAGPGSHAGIPVGTVCFAWAFRHGGKRYLYSETRRFSGDRNEVRLAAAHHALARLVPLHRRVLEGKAPPL